MYTEYQLDEVEQHTFTAVQLYFNNNIGVGNGLSKNRLSAYILQYLVDNRYDIYDIEIVIQPNSELGVTNNNQKVKVEEFEKIYPNKIYTKVEYNAE